ncbi:hypothetical protein N7478_003118 [Penicillium angulare]|uniref:uncharacterized protein n=1 Tax=Penicillium angulare TaxID=116970 RepID=UPI00253FCC2C|nr:uncharacterized protein N7478_003118 [Penicillium angulare]KAJ5287432.1 hypothetical protein N7478_003118 [Penicillium angulare]
MKSLFLQLGLGVVSTLASPLEFYMPAENQLHERTIMAWPRIANPSYTGHSGSLSRMKDELTSIANAISNFEPVTLLVSSEQATDARKRAQSSGQYGVKVKVTEEDDLEPWMRDVAPLFVFSEESQSDRFGLDFNFNGWGRQFPSDNFNFARKFLADERIPLLKTSITADGGALEVDGNGTLIAARTPILDSNRNRGMGQKVIEEELQRVLGVSKVIWIPGVESSDVSDDHIDGLARFVAPGKVVLSRPNPCTGVWAKAYYEAKRVLSHAVDAEGRSFELIDLPEAPTDNTDMVTSYVNFHLVNGAVISPAFGIPESDEAAKDILQNLFPNRKVVQVYIPEIALSGGGIHCMTQQIPAVGKENKPACLNADCR